MDLIDTQSLSDGEWKWIMVYQDHFTKFVSLRPLRAKSAVEVATNLFDIFSIFGVPYMLPIRQWSRISKYCLYHRENIFG